MQTAQVARTAAIVTAFSVLQKIAGFLRELAIARAFGATGATDAYVAGLTLAEVPANVASASLAGALLPAVSAATAGPVPGRAEQMTRTVLARVTAIGTLAVLLAFWAAPWLMQPLLAGRSPDLQALGLACARVALPGAALAAMGAVLRAYLYARHVFMVTPLGVMLVNLSVAVAAVLLSGLGPVWLAAASAAGNGIYLLLYAAAVFWVLRRRRVTTAATAQVTAAVNAGPGAPAAGALILPLVAWSLAGQASTVVERLFAADLAPGAVAALNFADRLRQFPLQTAMQAVAVVSYPALATAAAAGDRLRLQAVLGQGLRLAMLLALPMAMGLLTLSRPIVAMVYERGAFDATATALTAEILTGYALSVVGLAAAMLCAYACFSLGRPWVPVAAVLAGALVQAGGGWLLLERMGPAALAWAGGVGALANAGLQLWWLHGRLGAATAAAWLGGWTRPLLASAAMAGACVAAGAWLSVPPAADWPGVATLAAVAGAALLYAGLLRCLGVPEAALLLDWLRRRQRGA